jgi:DNA-binding LytR/AlgR family response regulator
MTRPTALIAEDEPLLAQALRAELAQAWPELEVTAVVGDGRRAVTEALRLLPDVLFLDIRMPGQDGLAAAAELADAWPLDRAPLPQLVFVTAYNEYAVQAFETQAVDYVLKPVQPERLRKTIMRLQAALVARQTTDTPTASAAEPISTALDATLAQWRRMLLAAEHGSAGAISPSLLGALPTPPLQVIAASEAGSAGATVRMVPISDVQYFEAADKYVRVLTAQHEYLIRTPLKQLLPQLDAQNFWQVHRAVVVNVAAIDSVHRDDAGKLNLQLKGRGDRLAVSRLFAHLFRAM